jgi:divalent metal cation (Fe/Co/Zn/Cd) transporter
LQPGAGIAYLNQTMRALNDAEHAVYVRAGRRVEYASIAWTSMESVAGIVLAVLAGSVALLGFGIDSVIEVASSAVLVWRLNATAGEAREKSAHRLVGCGFLALALFILIEAVRMLVTHSPPRPSYFGILYAAACVIVMPLLARAKRRAAETIDSDALHADSHQSDICALLSVILLAGLGLNALFGWWWADPAAALCMVPIILREAVAGLRGEPCSHDHVF